jgi:hypothetical protein
MDFKDWKQRNQDPLQYWLSKLSKQQLSLLDEVKNRLNSHIDGFSQIKRDELQTKIDNHISNRARIELLERYHAEIVNKTQFLETYRNVLTRPIFLNNEVSFDRANLINDELFNAFIMSFEVVGLSSPYVNDLEEIKAIEYLEDVATLNLIEYERQKLIEDEISGNSRFKNIPEWQRVLAKLANRFDYNAPTVKFTILFYFMKKRKILPEKFIQGTFMDYVRNKYLNNEGFTKMDFPGHEYELKVKPHETKLIGYLEAP